MNRQTHELKQEEDCPLRLHRLHPHSDSSLAGFLVQFEEDRWEPGRWQNLTSFSGDLNSVVLQLAPFVNYQFRVIAVNSVGQSDPSRPSPRYKTSGAGKEGHESNRFMCRPHSKR